MQLQARILIQWVLMLRWSRIKKYKFQIYLIMILRFQWKRNVLELPKVSSKKTIRIFFEFDKRFRVHFENAGLFYSLTNFVGFNASYQWTISVHTCFRYNSLKCKRNNKNAHSVYLIISWYTRGITVNKHWILHK
jgi:hypothetical protein